MRTEVRSPARKLVNRRVATAQPSADSGSNPQVIWSKVASVHLRQLGGWLRLLRLRGSRFLLAECRTPFLHVEMKMVLVSFIGIRSKHRPKGPASVIVKIFHEFGLLVG
jgi:hypothetical protein